MRKISKVLLFIILTLIPSTIMEINEKGLNLLKVHEGFSATPYKDTGGVLTVGYGHTGKITGPVTKEQAEELLKSDLKIAQDAVEYHIKTKLTDNQFSALVSFVYNIGATNFGKSTLKSLINQGKYPEAANQFDKWVYDNGRKLPGLVKRRQMEKELFLS